MQYQFNDLFRALNAYQEQKQRYHKARDFDSEAEQVSKRKVRSFWQKLFDSFSAARASWMAAAREQ